MKISFGAKILTKPEQFFLPKDTEEEKNLIRKNFNELANIFEIEPIKKFTQNDTLSICRKKSKHNLRYSIKYKPHNSEEMEIKFHLLDTKSFSAYDIFHQITYFLAYINNKLPDSLFLCGDFQYILKNLYLNKDKN